MGTRGLYGFRKNGEDKTTYNHWDSYPNGLGSDVIKFCKNHSIEEMNNIFDKIVMVSEDDKPTERQINDCINNGYSDFTVSSGEETNWYCLLRNCQGNLEYLAKRASNIYMIDNGDFIKDSLFCEYAYIINLDDNVLEFWEGFQKKPQEGNRYGIKDDRGYYPCKLSLTFPLNEIDNVDKIIDMMNLGENAEDVYETIRMNSVYDLTAEEAKDIIGKKVVSIWSDVNEVAEQEAKALGLLNDDNEKYFNLDLYGKDLLKESNYIELESGRVVLCEM